MDRKDCRDPVQFKLEADGNDPDSRYQRLDRLTVGSPVSDT
jgi:hypothetical protein